jgi:RNA polymerase sigma-70 factor (ECF subfamily)
VTYQDRDLLGRAQQGDPAAFEELIRPHLASVRRFAYAFSHNWSDADDLAQEALIKAFRSLPRFEQCSALTTWLYTVTRSVCLDHLRSRAARERQLDDCLDERLIDDSEGQDALLCHKADAEQLWRAIRGLEPEFRAALVLFDIEGLSYEQVAEAERIPVGTVRSRLSRARQRLAAALRPVRTSVPAPGTQVAHVSSKLQGGPAE